MKILHCADLHLGSKLESKYDNSVTETRKKEVLATFKKMVDYAKENDIKHILLSGDVFDKAKPAVKDKTFFYSTIEKNPDIEFLYLKGNHDIEGSYTNTNLPNLKTFNSNNFVSYEYDNVCISGLEMTEENASSFYSMLTLDRNKVNIVMLHGDVSESVGMDKIKIDLLRNKGIDYLALGHIHTFKDGTIDDRGKYAFPGCPEGRGFDETGIKGFIELDIDDGVKYKFVPFACRTIWKIEVDITNSNDLSDIIEKVEKSLKEIPKKDIVRVILTGSVKEDLLFDEEDVETKITGFFFVNVKKQTRVLIDIEKYNKEQSLISEFVKKVYNSSEYSDDLKERIITVGLKLLNEGEID